MNLELQLLGILGLAIHYLKDWEANNRDGKKYDLSKSIPTILLSAITTSVLIYLKADIENLFVVTPFGAVVLGYLGNSVFFSFVTARKPTTAERADILPEDGGDRPPNPPIKP